MMISSLYQKTHWRLNYFKRLNVCPQPDKLGGFHPLETSSSQCPRSDLCHSLFYSHHFSPGIHLTAQISGLGDFVLMRTCFQALQPQFSKHSVIHHWDRQVPIVLEGMRSLGQGLSYSSHLLGIQHGPYYIIVTQKILIALL